MHFIKKQSFYTSLIYLLYQCMILLCVFCWHCVLEISKATGRSNQWDIYVRFLWSCAPGQQSAEGGGVLWNGHVIHSGHSLPTIMGTCFIVDTHCVWLVDTHCVWLVDTHCVWLVDTHCVWLVDTHCVWLVDTHCVWLVDTHCVWLVDTHCVWLVDTHCVWLVDTHCVWLVDTHCPLAKHKTMTRMTNFFDVAIHTARNLSTPTER